MIVSKIRKNMNIHVILIVFLFIHELKQVWYNVHLPVGQNFKLNCKGILKGQQAVALNLQLLDNRDNLSTTIIRN